MCVFRHQFRGSEIRNLADPVLINQDVLRLEVPVDDVALVQVVHAFGDIVECLNLSSPVELRRFRVQDVCERTFRHVLGDGTQMRG